MTAVTLTEIFLNDAANPSDFMAFAYAGDEYTLTTSRGGGVEGGYASGRVRGWSTAERRTTGAVTFHLTTPAQRAWLEAHLGTTVCLRDHHGYKAFGQYRELPTSLSTFPTDFAAADNTVSVSFQSVTWSEAV